MNGKFNFDIENVKHTETGQNVSSGLQNNDDNGNHNNNNDGDNNNNNDDDN